TPGITAVSYRKLKQGHRGVQSQSSRANPPFTEKFFSQVVDHFNFNSLGNATFNQRYLITDRFWKKSFGPIFFYTGNEGDIWEFALNSGFILELAAQQEALVIFAEHRYYGRSLPFGNQSFSIPEVGLLTVEQALADYALMITELKLQLAAAQSPVIVFGGSYGGMLSVYMRLKYPNIVAGALAASAPILSTAGFGDPRQFFRDVTAVSLGEQIRLKRPVACDTMLGGSDLLTNLRDTAGTEPALGLWKHFKNCEGLADSLQRCFVPAGMVYNSSGLLPCFDLYRLYVECADPTGCGLGFNSLAWDYQACTEIEMCYESNNVTDMFPPMTFTQEARQLYCSKRWGVQPRPGWLRIQFWGDDLSTASNIIFSNGDLDPWANGGVRNSLSPSLIAINISDGAHHLDLRGSNAADPESVVKARKMEAELIAAWVKMERVRFRQSH
uniref:Dipeptidyl-peptidase 7 n=1 Tax=Oryzias melastigma TaxID=30732 RepID=A0A3B3CVX6_ORYME